MLRSRRKPQFDRLFLRGHSLLVSACQRPLLRRLRGLTGKAYDAKLYDVASKYYETITKHIRKYDQNHLILGDRYNGNKGIPTPSLEAMKPFVDVLSIQYFSGAKAEDHETMRKSFATWQEITGKPVLNADLGNWTATKLNPNRKTGLSSQAERGSNYVESLTPLVKEPWFIGWHWCAYVENTGRGWGIKDPWTNPTRISSNR